LKALAAADASERQEGGESAESMAAKLLLLEQRQLKYEGWRAQLAASGEGQISLTDEESRLMKSRQGQHVSYNVQIAVDSKHKLIADFAVTNEENDVNCLAAIAKGAQQELGVEQLQVCADKGYYNTAQIKECEEAQLSVYMERPRAKQVAGIFPLAQFRYDAGKDVYECPAGKRLRYRHTDKQKQAKLYWTEACHRCPLKSQCTSAKGPRKISRPLGQEAADRMLQRVAQQPQILELRKQLVEHPFGSIKRGMNQGHFLLRGKAKVTGESSLTFLAYNLKRALNVVGLERLMGGLDQQTGRKAPAQTARAALLWSQSPAVAKCFAWLNVRSTASKKLKPGHYFDWRIKTAFAISVS
jgi:hypothetical protein